MGQPSYFTVVETLLQRGTCPKRWVSIDTVVKWGILSQSIFTQLKLGIFSQFIMNQHTSFQLKDEKSGSKRLLIVKSCQRTKLFLTPWNHVFFCLRYNCHHRQPSPSKSCIVVMSHHRFKWTVWYIYVLICSCQKNSYLFSKPYPRCALKLLVYSDLKNIFNSKN